MEHGSTVLAIASNDEARALHRAQFFEGKHRGEEARHYFWPYDVMDNKPRTNFVLVEVPLDHVDALATSDERAERYAEILRESDMGPSWGGCLNKSMGVTRRKLEEHNPQIIGLLDGNHRAVAARMNGYPTIEVWMPEPAYQNYLERIKAY